MRVKLVWLPLATWSLVIYWKLNWDWAPSCHCNEWRRVSRRKRRETIERARFCAEHRALSVVTGHNSPPSENCYLYILLVHLAPPNFKVIPTWGLWHVLFPLLKYSLLSLSLIPSHHSGFSSNIPSSKRLFLTTICKVAYSHSHSFPILFSS